MAERSDSAVNCLIYRCARKAGMFIYLRADMPLDELPESLVTATGKLEFSFELVLTAETKLASESICTVLKNLRLQGYHLQMPPPDVAVVAPDERLPSSLDVG